MSKILASLVALLLTGAVTPAPVAAQEAPSRTLTITAPLAPMLPAGRVEIRGMLGSGDGSGGTVVLLAVDVSGSTAWTTQDCSGDQVVDETDDLNADGVHGDVLDCQIAAVVSLLTSFAGRGDIRVGLIPYGTTAVAADLSPAAGQQSVISAVRDSDDGGDRDRLPDLINVASSMQQGQVELFTPRWVGEGTDFNQPLTVAHTLFGEEARRRGNDDFNKVVLFLSDGQAQISSTDPAIELLSALGATANTYAVGAGTEGCTQHDPLRTISDELMGTCTPVLSPSTLTAAIEGTEGADIQVEIRGTELGTAFHSAQTTAGPFGEYAVTFPDVRPGRWDVVVTSGEIEARRSISVRARGHAIAYAALGDSYSSGEGSHPWRNEEDDAPSSDPLDDECHRSVRGYPMQVRMPADTTAIAHRADSRSLFSFGACAGAITQNFLYRPQRAGGVEIPLQVNHVGPETDLVTFSAGGNDIEFSQIAMHCITQFDCNQRDGFGSDGFAALNSGETLTLPEYADLRLAILAAQMPGTYKRVKEASEWRATVVAVGYPELFQPKPSVLCSTRAVITRGEREYLSKAAKRMDALLATAAARSGIFYVSVIEEFKPHLPCGDEEQWLGGIATGVTDKGKKLHPTDAGYRGYADLISAALADWVDDPPRGVKPNGLPFNPPTRAPRARSTASAAPTARVAGSDAWLDESLDPTPPLDESILPGVATDGLAVDAQGKVVFDPWLSEQLPDLPSVSLEDLRSVAAAVEPDLTLTSASASACVDTAAPGSTVTATASGFAPGSTVSLERDGELVGLAEADRDGVATFEAVVPSEGVTFTASGPTEALALIRATAAVNPLVDNPCVLTAAPSPSDVATPGAVEVPQVDPAVPAVAPSRVTGQLPATGSRAVELLPLGSLLVALGIVLVGASRVVRAPNRRT